MAGEVYLTSTLSKDNVPVTGQAQLVYALLEIMPTDVMASVRMPLNFSLVLDRSGSMKDEGKLDQLKQAVKYVIDLLADDDYVSVIVFSGRVGQGLTGYEVITSWLRSNVTRLR